MERRCATTLKMPELPNSCQQYDELQEKSELDYIQQTYRPRVVA